MSEDTENKQSEDDEKAAITWEKEFVISYENQDEMETLWEMPQLCQFLTETKEALNLTDLSIYEVERMLFMPKASKQLSVIMTCLLSPPNLRMKLHKIPPMPFKFWTSILLQKCKNWFKVYHSKNKDSTKVLDLIGVEHEFWKIFPEYSCIEDTNFENLSLREKLWLLKTLCDTLMHTRKIVTDEIVRNSDENKSEMILGTDRYGATYFYFPQFLSNALRVYRHHMKNKILSVVQFPVSKEQQLPTNQNHLNSQGLSEHDSLPPLVASDKKSKEESEAKDLAEQANRKDSNEQKITIKSPPKTRRLSSWQKGVLPHDVVKRKKKRLRDLAKNANPKNSENCNQKSGDSSTANETDLKTIKKVMQSLLSRVEQESEGKKKLATKKKQASKKSSSPKQESSPRFETKNFWEAEIYVDEVVDQEMNDEEIYDCFFSEEDVKENNEYWTSNSVDFNSILEDISPSSFELVADSVETLRDLIAIISLNKEEKFDEIDRYKVLSEKRLISNLCNLVKTLENREVHFGECAKQARLKLQKEFLDYKKGITIETTWIGENGTTVNWWLFGAQNLPESRSSDSLLNTGRVGRRRKNRPRSEEKKKSEEKSGDEQEVRSTRVLRARGISSYSGQFSSDLESEFDDVDGWPVVDPIILCSDDPNSVSIIDSATERKSDSDSDKNSDQDWILPRKRKRKRKKQAIGRKLLTLQSKLNAEMEEQNSQNKLLVGVKEGPNSVEESSQATSQAHEMSNTSGENAIVNTSLDVQENVMNADVTDDKPICRIESIRSGSNLVFNTTPNLNQQQNPLLLQQTMIPGPRLIIHPPYTENQPPPGPLRHRHPLVIHRMEYPPQPHQIVRAGQPQMMMRMRMPGVQYPPPQQNQASLNVQPPRAFAQRSPIRMPPRMAQPRNIRPSPRAMGPLTRNAVPNPRPQMTARYPGPQTGPRMPAVPRPALANQPQAAANRGRRSANHRVRAPAPGTPSQPTSLIVLSDSDDDIEMIVYEKSTSSPTKTTNTPPTTARKSGIGSLNNVVPQQVIQRMSQGGISITPLAKPQNTPRAPAPTPAPQVVVVVNETGSHYALVLPNGSKLILTPEQVAQIRASNGGKLSL